MLPAFRQSYGRTRRRRSHHALKPVKPTVDPLHPQAEHKDGAWHVRNGSVLSYTMPIPLDGLLKSVRNEQTEYVTPGSGGLVLNGRNARSRALWSQHDPGGRPRADRRRAREPR